MSYNPFAQSFNQTGLFNIEDNNVKVLCHTTKLYKTGQYQYRITIPVQMEPTLTDTACFYTEPVEYNGKTYIRRVFQLLSQDSVETLKNQPENPKLFQNMNPRGLHHSGKSQNLYTIIPMAKLKAPKGDWSHIRFHITDNPNKYWIEFLNLDIEKQPDKTFVANNSYLPTSEIRWD